MSSEAEALSRAWTWLGLTVADTGEGMAVVEMTSTEEMANHAAGWVRMAFIVPSRGLIGFRTVVRDKQQ